MLMVVDEPRNGTEQVLLGQVKCGIPFFSLSDLVMFHIWIFLTICPAGNKELEKDKKKTK